MPKRALRGADYTPRVRRIRGSSGELQAGFQAFPSVWRSASAACFRSLAAHGLVSVALIVLACGHLVTAVHTRCEPPQVVGGSAEAGFFHKVRAHVADRETVRRRRLAQRTDRGYLHPGRGETRGQGSVAVAGPAKCQALFLEFEDERRLPLSAKLRELETDPAGYLRMVLFLDGVRSGSRNRHGGTRVHRPGQPDRLFMRARFRTRLAQGCARNPGHDNSRTASFTRAR